MNVRHLKNISSKEVMASERFSTDRRAIKGFGSGVKTPLDKICAEGINHVDLFLEHGDPRPISDTAREADRLLEDRFVSMFFWPAVLSTVDRQDGRRGGDNLFAPRTATTGQHSLASVQATRCANEQQIKLELTHF